MNPFWRAYFSDGLKPPTSNVCTEKWAIPKGEFIELNHINHQFAGAFAVSLRKERLHIPPVNRKEIEDHRLSTQKYRLGKGICDSSMEGSSYGFRFQISLEVYTPNIWGNHVTSPHFAVVLQGIGVAHFRQNRRTNGPASLAGHWVARFGGP